MSSTGTTAAALALVFNAFVWGVSWWPLRQLQQAGLHPLWSTAAIFLLAVLLIGLGRPSAWRALMSTPSLWVLVAASGTTNASFNWAVTQGDVVRVVLLFYLMPLWAVLFARLLLDERFGARALLRVAAALAGAAIVLWPDCSTGAACGWPVPRHYTDWLGILGGLSFALNNVMLRRLATLDGSSRALAMFLGGMLVAAVVAVVVVPAGSGWPSSVRAPWLLGLLALGLLFLAGNRALQYGAARLPASATAVIMLTEVMFATASSALLGAGRLDGRTLAGGALIVIAALLSALPARLARPAAA